MRKIILALVAAVLGLGVFGVTPANATSGTCTTVTGHFELFEFVGEPAYVLPDFSVNNAKGPMAIIGGSAMMVTNWNLYGYTIGYIHASNYRYAFNYQQWITYPYSLAMVRAVDTASNGNPNVWAFPCNQNNLTPV